MIERALLVEWMVGNCPHEMIPAFTAAAASMVINGHASPDEVQAVRQKIREGMAKHYPSVEAGCAALLMSMGISPSRGGSAT